MSDFLSYVRQVDIDRWKMEKRYDILEYVDNHVWAGDRIISSSGISVNRCIFLKQCGDITYCDIYETRPLTCRNYQPGSTAICRLYTENT